MVRRKKCIISRINSLINWRKKKLLQSLDKCELPKVEGQTSQQLKRAKEDIRMEFCDLKIEQDFVKEETELFDNEDYSKSITDFLKDDLPLSNRRSKLITESLDLDGGAESHSTSHSQARHSINNSQTLYPINCGEAPTSSIKDEPLQNDERLGKVEHDLLSEEADNYDREYYFSTTESVFLKEDMSPSKSTEEMSTTDPLYIDKDAGLVNPSASKHQSSHRQILSADSQNLHPIHCPKLQASQLKSDSSKICDKSHPKHDHCDQKDLKESLILKLPAAGKHLKSYSVRKGHACSICKKKFRRKDQLKYHLMTRFKCSSEKPFVCNICNKRFKLKSILNKHIWSHSGEKPFVCNICDKRFKQKVSLNAHLMSHSRDKPFVCKICNKGFKHEHALNVHLRTHPKDKPFVCKICNKGFIHESSINKHLISQICKKPFVCKICDERFEKKPYLTHHLKSHMGERPFVCSNCNEGFPSKRNLHTHLYFCTRDVESGSELESVESVVYYMDLQLESESESES